MSSLYAGLDVPDKNTAICIISSTGHIVHEGNSATDPADIALALKPFRKLLDSVAQESGAKAAWLHKELSRRRLPMVCLDARHAQAALAAKPNKTVKNDARRRNGVCIECVEGGDEIRNDIRLAIERAEHGVDGIALRVGDARECWRQAACGNEPESDRRCEHGETANVQHLPGVRRRRT